MALEFWFHPLSSYCHKVLIALYEKSVPFTPVLLDFGDAQQAAAFRARWPMAKMPLLLDTGSGEQVVESSIMLEWLDARFDERPRLLPDDPAAALGARFWDRVFDQYVHAPVQAIVAERLRPEDRRDPFVVEDARARIRRAYAYIETNLGDDGWMLGQAFSMADCAASPALFYAHELEPIGEECPKTLAYRERLMLRPAYARALREAAPYFKYYPMEKKPDISILDRSAA